LGGRGREKGGTELKTECLDNLEFRIMLVWRSKTYRMTRNKMVQPGTGRDPEEMKSWK
jgi:hypothetical protein